MKQKILSTTMDCYGEETPTAVLIQKEGLLYLWEVMCLSSKAHNLGNCECINHEATVEDPISTADVIQRFGIEALDGFEAPGREQLIFDAFGVEAAELETYLRLSYNFGSNPLPGLRDATGNRIVFGEDPDLLVFPEEEPGTKIFVVNSRGEISVREAQTEEGNS